MKKSEYQPLAHAISKFLVFGALMEGYPSPIIAQKAWDEAMMILTSLLAKEVRAGRVADEVLKAANLELNEELTDV